MKNRQKVLNDYTWAKFFLGFGIYTNITKWLDTNVPNTTGHLGCLDGIRFISMTWVVLCHAWSNAMGMNFNQPLDLIMVWIIIYILKSGILINIPTHKAVEIFFITE